MRRWCATLGSLLVVACSSGSAGVAPPVPPPGTGQLSIDMNSRWAVLDIERVDSSGLPLPFHDPGATPFLSVQPAQTIAIWQGVALDPATGRPLYEEWSAGIPNRRYLNVADGRHWIFDFEFEHQVGCYTYVSVRAAFGTVDHSTLDGIVEVRYLSSCPAPAVVRPNPDGVYRVRLVKDQAAQPALGSRRERGGR